MTALASHRTVIEHVSLAWAAYAPDQWRSTDGHYVILRSVLPGERTALAVIFTLRKRGDAEIRAWGEGYLGYHLGEHFSLWEAQEHAHRDARADRAAQENIATLDSLPAVAMAPFWWPISNGTTRGRLVVAEEDGRLLACIVGMSCQTETEWQPGVYAEIDITELLPRRPGRIRRWLSRRAHYAGL